MYLIHTYQVRDFAPNYSALAKSFCSRLIGVSRRMIEFVFTRQIYPGKINKDVKVSALLRLHHPRQALPRRPASRRVPPV